MHLWPEVIAISERGRKSILSYWVEELGRAISGLGWASRGWAFTAHAAGDASRWSEWPVICV